MTLVADPTAVEDVSAVAALDLMSRHTTAPRRIVGRFIFHASVELVFERMTDPKQIAGWMGPITGGSTDHSRSETTGDWGAGSKRYCETSNMGLLDETIAEWRRPSFVVYKIENEKMPITNHAAYMRFVSAGSQRAEVEWAQYFDFKPGLMRFVFPAMMRKMMRDGMTSLRAELGGEPGEVRRA